MLAKFAVKAIPKIIANPVVAAEMAPFIIVAGIAAAVTDIVKKN